MSNKQIFRALSSNTRMKILKILALKEMHLTGVAKEVGISKPVASRHINILEDAGLIEKRIVGNVHILKAKTKNLEKLLEPYVISSTIKISKKDNLFDALEQVPGIEVKKMGKHGYIKSIDEEEGYYIYEVDGKLPNKPIDEYVITKSTIIDLKKIISVKKKKINIKIKEE